MSSLPDFDQSSHSVNLYVYDLSNGLARSMSMAWTGRQFDAIWHTSVVYDDQVELFFGQGIMRCQPGHSHHGQPLKIINFGHTMIDPSTLTDYIEGLRQSWTPEAYHLLERNCNHFSNELISFLTGGSIPEDILDLPRQFLETPMGASMRPMIDQMFRGPAQLPSVSPAVGPSGTLTPAHLLASVASSAYNTTSDVPVSSCTTPAALDALLANHRCVVVNFTNERGCPPCRAIAPVYEQLAKKFHPTPSAPNPPHGRPSKVKDVCFVKVDTSMSQEISARYRITATPTFKFFINTKQIGELKGANAVNLTNEVNLMLFTAYPPHPHLKLNLPKLASLSPTPILYTQPFDFSKALAKLLGGLPSGPNSSLDVVRQTYEWVVVPFLEHKTDLNSPERFVQWSRTTVQVLDSLPPSASFPALDFLRLAVLRQEYIDQLVLCPFEKSPLAEALRVADAREASDGALPRPFSLTLLRLLSNTLAAPALADQVIDAETRIGPVVMRFLVARLLDLDSDVRVLASGVCYGLVARWAGKRCDFVDEEGDEEEGGREEEWEVEMLSALIESLRREAQRSDGGNAEMLHRLLATVGKFLYLSPFIESLKTLIESLGFVEDCLVLAKSHSRNIGEKIKKKKVEVEVEVKKEDGKEKEEVWKTIVKLCEECKQLGC